MRFSGFSMMGLSMSIKPTFIFSSEFALIAKNYWLLVDIFRPETPLDGIGVPFQPAQADRVMTTYPPAGYVVIVTSA